DLHCRRSVERCRLPASRRHSRRKAEERQRTGQCSGDIRTRLPYRNGRGTVRQYFRHQCARTLLSHAGRGATPAGAPGGRLDRQRAFGQRPLRSALSRRLFGKQGGAGDADQEHGERLSWKPHSVQRRAAGWMDTEGEDMVQRKWHGAGDDWLQKAEAAQPMGQLVKPGQLARLITYMLSPDSGVMTGALVDYDQNVLGVFGG